MERQRVLIRQVSRLYKLSVFIFTFSCILMSCSSDDPPPYSDPLVMGGGDMNSSAQGLLRVDTPRQGEVISTRDVVVTGVHQQAAEVAVNGMLYPITNQQFSVTITLEEGPQTILVRAGEDEVSVGVFIDLSSPQLQIFEPALGAHVDSAREGLVTVVGQALDAQSGVERVLVNGEEVLVEHNGRFQFTYEPEEGLNRIVVIAYDQAGHDEIATRGFLYGRFKPWESPLERTARGHLTPESFAVISQTLEAALKGGIVQDLVSQSGVDTGDIRIEEVLFQDVEVGLIPMDGFLKVELTLFDLRVFFELTSPATRGDVYISPARLSLDLYIIPQPDGSLDTQIMNKMVSLENLNVQVDNTLIDVALSFVESYIRDFAEEALLQLLDEVLLNELISPDLFSPRVTLLDVELRLRALIREVLITPGGLTMETGFQIDDLPSINRSPGYLYGPTTDFPQVLTDQASLDLFLNGFHLLLSHLWYGGLLNFTLADLLGMPPAQLSAILLNGFTGGRLIEIMSPTDPVGVRLRPSLPPVMRFDAARNDLVIIDLVDLLIDFTTADGQIWFTGIFDITATIKPQIINNDLTMEITLNVEGVSHDEPLFPVQSEDLTGVIKSLVENLPQQLGQDGVNEIFSFSQIDFYGLTFTSAEMRSVLLPDPTLQIGLNLRVIPSN